MKAREVSKMIKHFMILSSSYSTGTRIAMHYVIDKHMNPEMLIGDVKRIKELCGETVSISTHYIETNATTWQSVVEKDAFFKDVHVIKSLEKFIKLITKDLKLTGLDIAKYILSNYICTHITIEKLVYMCYADYLCATKKKLFEDKIYAFKYGPVIESVYKEYKGMREIEEGHAVDGHLEEEYAMMPARSRILFAKDGIEKLIYIDETLKKYGNLSATELINMTHVAGGPWDSVNKTALYTEIPDSIILEKHYKECIH